MNNAAARLPSHVVSGFMARAIAAGIDPARLHILEASTDDFRADLEAGRVSLHARNFTGRRPMPTAGANRGSSGRARLEENYFYSSRRFPSLTTNTISTGLLTAGAFALFNKGIGEDGQGLGFPSGFTLGQAETNLEVGGYLPQGSNFVGSQLGVTFNSDIATADLAQFMDCATLNFAKAGGQFGLMHGPLKAWPGGMGVGGYSTAVTVTAAHNGAADIRAVRSLRIPRVLREKDVFNYSIFISRTSRATDGVAIGLTNFIVATIWLFGGQKTAIPS
jgi:hypothetical protein